MKSRIALKRSVLDYTLVPISIRELFFLKSCPCDIFALKDGLYKEVLKENHYIDYDIIKELHKNGKKGLYTREVDHLRLIETQQENLRLITRSLSIGDPLENGKKQINLLAINLAYLYENPMNDTLLNLQYQSCVNLFRFLYDNSEIHEKLYIDFIKHKHHYIVSQPFLSSLFLLGVLKHSHSYSPKELESLFLTSYFKDIGMSIIPISKYNEEKLSGHDKKLLSNHPEISVEILKGRVPLSPNHLKMIENHHAFSLLVEGLNKVEKDNGLILSGMETMMISTMDIISAMISSRPYREATSLFESLEMIKKLISDEYPNEFRLIVTYFKNFFAKTIKKKT